MEGDESMGRACCGKQHSKPSKRCTEGTSVVSMHVICACQDCQARQEMVPAFALWCRQMGEAVAHAEIAVQRHGGMPPAA